MAALFLAAVGVVVGGGCRGIPTAGEREARARQEAVRDRLWPADAPAPALDASATLESLLTFAMVHHPRVEATYQEYAAEVERITLERSLPDPRLTLELDVQEVVMIVMPGLMVDLPWVRKLRLRADLMTAASEARYEAFAAEVLQVAFEVKRPFFQLHFLDQRGRILRDTLALMGEIEQTARGQNQAGRGTLQDVLRAQIEQERLRTEIRNLEDSRLPLVAQLKGALGLRPGDPDPPVPAGFEPAPLDLSPDQILASAGERNPRLRRMEAEVRAAETGIRLAHLSRLPDFSLGVDADVKATPTMWRPRLGVTLPVWRDKIAAEIGAAQAMSRAAQARLSAEEIQLAVEYADRAFLYREATRNLRLLSESLLPKARQALEVARVGYSSGRTDFINLQEAQRSLLEFELAEVEARTRRELALAELSLLIVGIPPVGSPALPAPRPAAAGRPAGRER